VDGLVLGCIPKLRRDIPMPGVRVANTAVIEDSNHEQGLFALL